MADYYSLKHSEVFRSLNSSVKGLSEKESEKRLKEYGLNELKKEKRSVWLDIFVNQFKNALILLLVFACILSLLLGEKIEAFAIFVIIIINAILGFIQEYRADRSVQALKKMASPTATVLRDGRERKISSAHIVPGDILLLEAGDIVAADSRIFEGSSLQIDEASLTGESVPSKKVIDPLPFGTSIADQENMAFTGTVVTYGKGKSIVVSTGENTELGKIASSLETTKEAKTHLQVKFERLARQIGIITLVIVSLVFVVGLLQHILSFGEMLLVALTLTVSTIPNSLPLVVTIGLSIGTKNLARRNMLIKKLPAAESLGAATIICSDKTGTITKNQMTITDVYYDREIIKVTGAGYVPEGDFIAGGKRYSPKNISLLLRIGYLCNNAELSKKGRNFEIIGDPTEGALTVLGRKGGIDDSYVSKNFWIIEELPFDSERKRM